MTTEHTYDEKGKVKPRPKREPETPQKETAVLTQTQIEQGLNPATVAQMQRTLGNNAVQRYLAQRQATGPAEVEEETANAINNQRGQGSRLDTGMAEKAGQVMGQDFTDVTVHTDGQADQLSRQLGAKAFTTGNDIFFREGAYDPASSDGQRLIAHELTHVVQQGAAPAAVQGKMTVNDPEDQFEAEADRVADTVMMQPAETAVLRQDEEEEEAIQMQEMEEEEEVQMQPIEEEEEEMMP